MQSLQTTEPVTVKSPLRRQDAMMFLKNRRVLILLALTLIAGGAALGWDWLVAVGIAPVLVAFAPCAAMCALGLCMSRMGNKSCSTGDVAAERPASKRASTDAQTPGTNLRD